MTHTPARIRRPVPRAAVLALLAAAWSPPTGECSTAVELRPRPALAAAPAAGAPAVELALDDGTSELDFGVGAGGAARQFLWLNRFADPGPFRLEEIRVQFPPGLAGDVGAAVELAVYVDGNDDTTDGAELVATFPATVQRADGGFSVYPLAPAVALAGGGEVLLGVVPRFIDSGVTPPRQPAAVDVDLPAGRSWYAVWSGDPPSPPELPADELTAPLEGAGAGNWMIRGYGTPLSPVEVPALGRIGLLLLTALLAVAGLRRLRRRRAVLAGGVLLALLAAPAAAQPLLDDFSVDQGPLADPGGPLSSSVAAGLGGERDLAVALLTGAGPVTAGVSGGVLEIAVADTGPDSRGEASVVWDGADGSPDLDPVGLAGIDFILAGDATGLALTVDSAAAGSELTVELFSDADRVSRIDHVTAEIAAPTVILFGYDDLVPTGSAGGADLTDVGAVRLLVRGTERSISVSRFTAVGPALALAKIDALADDGDGDGEADPGELLGYRLELTNAGGDAHDVEVVDPLAADLALEGTVRSSPLARRDRYEACGNVSLAVAAADGVLANDFDLDGDPLTVDVAASDTASLQGGSVTWHADGSFDYYPPPGFSGVDQLRYELELDGDDPPGGTSGAPVAVTVAPGIWFVDADDVTPPFEGTQRHPFATLGQAEAAARPGDTLFLYTATAAYDGGIALLDGQRLIGQGVDGVACGEIVAPAAARPEVTHGGGDAVVLATDNLVRGLDVVAPAGRGISGAGFGTLRVDEVDVVDAGAEALDLTGGTADVVVGTLSSLASTAGGLRLDAVAGSVTAGTTSVTDPQGGGIEVLGAPAGAAFAFGATAVTQAGDAGGAAAPGVHLAANDATATIVFDTLTITTENGAGLAAASAGTVAAPAGSVVSIGGPAVDVDDTTIALALASLSSTDSPAQGIGLTRLRTGSSLAVSGLTTVRNAAAVGDVFTSGAINVDTVAAGSTLSFGEVRILERNETGIFVTDHDGSTLGFGQITVANPNLAGGYGLRIQDSSAAVTIAGADVSGTVQTVAETTVASVPTDDGDGDGLFLAGNSGSFNLLGGTIEDTGDGGIDARGVADVTLTGVTLRNPAGDGFRAIDLTGVNRIENAIVTEVDASGTQGVLVINRVATASSLTVTGSTFSDSLSSSTSLRIEARDVSDLTVRVEDGNRFSGLFGAALTAVAGFGATDTAALDFTASGNTFEDAEANGTNTLVVQLLGTAEASARIEDNVFRNVLRTLSTNSGVINCNLAQNVTVHELVVEGNRVEDVGDPVGGRGIQVFVDAAAVVEAPIVIHDNDVDDLQRSGVFLDIANVGDQVDARITDNRIGVATPVGQRPSGQQAGIEIFKRRSGGGTSNVLVSGNQVVNSNTGSLRVSFFANSEDDTTLNLTVTDNELTNMGGPNTVLMEQFDGSTLCLTFTGNDLDDGTTGTALDGDLDTFEDSGTFTINDLANLATNNNGGTFSIDPGITSGAVCPTP